MKFIRGFLVLGAAAACDVGAGLWCGVTFYGDLRVWILNRGAVMFN